MNNALLYQSYTSGFEFCLIHILFLLRGERATNENFLIQVTVNCLSLSIAMSCPEEVLFVVSFLCKHLFCIGSCSNEA